MCKFCVPPGRLVERPQNAWKPYKFRTDLRHLKEIRAGDTERRGAHEKFNDEESIRFYVDIEARARLVTGGVVLRYFNHHELRLVTADGTKHRLDERDKQRLRRRYSEGKREAHVWKNMKFLERPHPRWLEIARQIEARMEELRSQKKDYFFSIVDDK